MFKFNVGSAINGQDLALDLSEVYIKLWHCGFNAIRLERVAKSNTESTYVLTSESFSDDAFDTFEEAVLVASRLLKQDCIAFKKGDVGYLIGDKADEWGGTFNPEYFIE